MDAGVALVTLETERGVILADLDPIDPEAPDAPTVQGNWHKAIDTIVAGTSAPVVGGRFEATLTLDEVPPYGSYYLKVYAEDGVADSFGYLEAPYRQSP